MSYFISKILSISYDDALGKTREALKTEGFGVLTEIDVKATLKNKLQTDFRKYMILGACNPSFAYRALQTEAMVGLLLPCNVVVQEKDEGITEVSAIDPVAAMQVIGNEDLEDIANEVREKLIRALNRL